MNDINKKIESKKKFLKNFFSLFIVQGTNYLLPLITFPYLLKVIGVANFGVLALATATIAFFAVITDYGFNFTATREISLLKDNKIEVVKIFSSVMLIKFALMIICFIALILLVNLIPKFQENSLIYILSFGVVIGQVFFPIWFFQGMEEMQFISIINVISRIVSTLCIFVFINSIQDFILVPIFLSLGNILGGFYSIYLIYSKFKVGFEIQPLSEIKKHIKSGFNLFLTNFMGTLLTSSGVIILGIYTTNNIVGIYSATEKIFRSLVGLFSPVTQALYPISCRIFNNYNILDQKRYFVKMILSILFLTIFLSTIVMIFSKEILNIFYGNTLNDWNYILQIMMVWLIFSVMNNIIGVQYLSAKRREKQYSLAFAIAALITVVMNFILIPIFNINGIVISMIFGEIMLTILMLNLFKRKKI